MRRPARRAREEGKQEARTHDLVENVHDGERVLARHPRARRLALSDAPSDLVGLVEHPAALLGVECEVKALDLLARLVQEDDALGSVRRTDELQGTLGALSDDRAGRDGHGVGHAGDGALYPLERHCEEKEARGVRRVMRLVTS